MKHKDKDNWGNPYFSLSDLELSKEQEEAVLMWFARKLWVILEEGSGEPNYHCKHYDPLVIEGNMAHSYVFNFEDGGRHHPFESLEQLEEMLVKGGITSIKELTKEKYMEGARRCSILSKDWDTPEEDEAWDYLSRGAGG